MQKRKAVYCSKCGEKTVHTFVDRDCGGSGFGPIFRTFLAICTVGTSEITTSENWECSKCKNINTIS